MGQRIAERMIVEVRVEECYMGEERETRQGWFELHVGGFGTRRLMQLCPALRGLGYVVEWREGGTATMRKALEWPTTSMRASPTLFLTGTVSLNVEDSWLRSEKMQHR